MKSLNLLLIAAAACGIVSVGCNQQQASGSSSTSAPAARETAAQSALPAGLFAESLPTEGALPVFDARSKVEAGAEVTLTGYIGGRVEPFIEGRAMFVLADPAKAISCDSMGGEDHCATPWDACCAPREDIAAGTATIQVTDAAGQPLKVALNGAGGLKPGSKITVQGKVRTKDEGAFIVDATRIALTAE